MMTVLCLSYGRFLNADTTEILERTKGTVLGANIFAYCNNNPVMYVDYTGEISLALAIVITFILIVSGVSVAGISAFLKLYGFYT